MIIIFGILSTINVKAQTIISGRVTDASSGDPIPFCNIYINSTKEGTITDFEGNYRILLTQKYDSITASFVGYKKTSYPLINKSLKVNFNLESETQNLDEFVFVAEENPAHLENNLVYIFAGGELPSKFLQQTGVEITKRFGYILKEH